MANIMLGSARSDERGKITGGAGGDQKQVSSINDLLGEVSMQPFYLHSKGWIIIRPKSVDLANKIAVLMVTACNNPNLGYNQNDRYGVIKYGINTKVKTNCDCSSLVRACVKEAAGKDPGDFNTSTEWSILNKTGLFDKITYVNQSSTPVYNGDILVTKTKGHTVAVVSGNPRSSGSNVGPIAPSTSSPAKITASKTADKKLTSLSGSYKVTADLNLRDGAGTSHKSLVVIPKNTIVKNYGYYSVVDGVSWLYIQFTLGNVTYTGFASSKYLVKQ